jgi:hypothetical protein
MLADRCRSQMIGLCSSILVRILNATLPLRAPYPLPFKYTLTNHIDQRNEPRKRQQQSNGQGADAR